MWWTVATANLYRHASLWEHPHYWRIIVITTIIVVVAAVALGAYYHAPLLAKYAEWRAKIKAKSGQ